MAGFSWELVATPVAMRSKQVSIQAAVSSSVSRPRPSELVSRRNGVISGGGADAGIERRAARFGGEGLGEALFVGLPHQLGRVCRVTSSPTRRANEVRPSLSMPPRR